MATVEELQADFERQLSEKDESMVCCWQCKQSENLPHHNLYVCLQTFNERLSRLEEKANAELCEREKAMMEETNG